MPCIYNRTTLLLKCLQNNLIIVIIRIGSNFFFQNFVILLCVCVLYIMKMNAYFQVFDLFE